MDNSYKNRKLILSGMYLVVTPDNEVLIPDEIMKRCMRKQDTNMTKEGDSK